MRALRIGAAVAGLTTLLTVGLAAPPAVAHEAVHRVAAGGVTTKHGHYGKYRNDNTATCALSGGRVDTVTVNRPQVKPVPGWRGYRYHGRTIVAQNVVWQATLLYQEGTAWKSVADRYTYVAAKFGQWTREPALKPFRASGVDHGRGHYRVRETLTWLKPTGSGQQRDGWVTQHVKHYVYPYTKDPRGDCSDAAPACTNPAALTMYAGQALTVPLATTVTDPDGDPTSLVGATATANDQPIDGFVASRRGDKLLLTATSKQANDTVTVSYRAADAAGARSAPCSFAVTVTPAWRERAGEATDTWSDYKTAGGTAGKAILKDERVSVDCWVTGKQADDKDNYWYRLVGKPWNDGYYAPADAFFNGGKTLHSVAYDPRVPECP